MKYEPILTLKKSALQQAADKSRNKFIEDAYKRIETRITKMIEPDFNRAWNKFPQFEKPEIKEPNIIHSFYTPYCYMKLEVRRMNYIIVLSVNQSSLRAGCGYSSNQLLRIAFEATQFEREGFKIDDSLEIRIDNNIGNVYKTKVDELTDLKNLRYYNQKMKIEG